MGTFQIVAALFQIINYIAPMGLEFYDPEIATRICSYLPSGQADHLAPSGQYIGSSKQIKSEAL